MPTVLPDVLNQIGLFIGFFGSILLAFSAKVGVISKNGSIIFTGLDPMAPVEDNVERVRTSYWRHRSLSPAGWGMLTLSLFLQLLATCSQQ